MKNWGFDGKNIDISVRPQDDFYQYANGGWIKKTKIPPEEAWWGSFNMLRFDTEHKLKNLMDALLKKKSYPKGSAEQMVSDYYRAAIDMPARNKLGITPLAPMRAKIAQITSQDTLLQTLAYLHKEGVSGVWNSFVDQDSKNSAKYILHLWQGGLGLPERDYYLKDEPEQKRVRDAYVVHIEKLLKLAGFSKNSIDRSQEVVMRIETRLAKASMKKEDARDPEKLYHKVRLTPFWKEYFARIGAKDVQNVIVGQPEFFTEALGMLKEVSLADWKVYLEWHLINDFAGSLSEAFVKENFRFYSQVMYGTKKMKPLWRRALGSTNGALGEPFGKLYVAEYFPAEAKKKMDALVSDLFDVYEERMQELDWMSPATKKKATKKLRAISRKIGYPNKWDMYKGVVIMPDDYFGNIERVHAHSYKKTLAKLKKSVDRDEWFMSPQTVNAYCSQTLNDIAFPAAILQWPFFDLSADDALNYAGIGTVIGHEMTHAFDDNGAKFDINGNMKNWWTPADKKKFEAKAKLVVGQANAHEVQPGVNMSGQLTLGENIADLGGLVIGWDAYQKHLDKTGRKIVGGLSPEMRFFLAFAQMERTIARPEIRKMRALTDPHGDAPFRINGPLSNFEPFYEVYGVTQGDKLYREPAKRAKIW
ncbi:MAG: M13 family metallopeptidase [Candidatus Adlerbacteria bacterium]|nr:M13 family metallopeptidase [Candidatus Adlerbacteria bacterium]